MIVTTAATNVYGISFTRYHITENLVFLANHSFLALTGVLERVVPIPVLKSEPSVFSIALGEVCKRGRRIYSVQL